MSCTPNPRESAARHLRGGSPYLRETIWPELSANPKNDGIKIGAASRVHTRVYPLARVGVRGTRVVVSHVKGNACCTCAENAWPDPRRALICNRTCSRRNRSGPARSCTRSSAAGPAVSRISNRFLCARLICRTVHACSAKSRGPDEIRI